MKSSFNLQKVEAQQPVHVLMSAHCLRNPFTLLYNVMELI